MKLIKKTHTNSDDRVIASELLAKLIWEAIKGLQTSAQGLYKDSKACVTVYPVGYGENQVMDKNTQNQDALNPPQGYPPQFPLLNFKYAVGQLHPASTTEIPTTDAFNSRVRLVLSVTDKTVTVVVVGVPTDGGGLDVEALTARVALCLPWIGTTPATARQRP